MRLISGAKAYAQRHKDEQNVLVSHSCDMLACKLPVHHATYWCTSDHISLVQVCCRPSCSTTNSTMQAKLDCRQCIQFMRSFMQSSIHPCNCLFECLSACLSPHSFNTILLLASVAPCTRFCCGTWCTGKNLTCADTKPSSPRLLGLSYWCQTLPDSCVNP